MLGYLAQHSELPVPKVHHAAPELLVMEALPGGTGASGRAQEHAAALLAQLHSVRSPSFGLERDTLIGGLHQPNPPTDSWLEFFAEHRLRYMAEQAHRAGRLEASMRRQVDEVAGRLTQWLDEPDHPALLHGDIWSGNVLSERGRITGFIDPAIYYGDPEIELAFTTLFGTFGERFFAAYREQRPLAPGFFEERRDLYNLYPLLVHVRLFGGTYAGDVRRILSRFR